MRTNTRYCLDQDPTDLWKSDAIGSKDYLRDKQQKEQEALMEAAKLARLEKQRKMVAINESITSAILTENSIHAGYENNYRETKKSLINRVLTEMYVNALVLDNEFVIEHYDVFTNVVDEYIIANSITENLNNIAKANDSNILRDIEALCEACAKKSSKKKMKVATETNDASIFDDIELDSETEKEFQIGKDNMSAEEISELVQNKVLAVIKDEQNKKQKHDEFITELKSAGKTEEELTESLSRAFDSFDNKALTESTIFDSLFINTYKGYLMENANGRKVLIENAADLINRHNRELQIANGKLHEGNPKPLRQLLLKMVNDCRDMREIKFLEADRKRAIPQTRKRSVLDAKETDAHIAWLEGAYKDAIIKKTEEIKKAKPSLRKKISSKLGEKSALKESYDLGDLVSIAEEDVEGSDRLIDDDMLELDMDLILTEAITRYTMFELAHTIKLENFTADVLRNMSVNLIRG